MLKTPQKVEQPVQKYRNWIKIIQQTDEIDEKNDLVSGTESIRTYELKYIGTNIDFSFMKIM